MKCIHFSSSWKISISLSSLSKTTADSKRYVSMKPRKNKKYCQSVNICLQRSFAFSSVNFLYLLVKDNDKCSFFFNQPTARSLLSNAKPRLHFYISIILVLHQFLLFFAKMHGYIISTSKNQCSCDVRLPSI